MGVIAAYVSMDAFCGVVEGAIVTSTAKPLPLVQATVATFEAKGHKVEVFAADQGILSQALFRVSLPEVIHYLKEVEHIFPECGEAYNHNNGTPHIEHVIRQIKELQRFAMLYILRNPNLKHFQFTRIQILKLWGELFYWAIVIINLKPAYNDPTITKYGAYHGRKPDLHAIRLISIFSVLYVYRHAHNNELNSQHDFLQLGLYVGQSQSVPGAIRAAVLINKRVHIITTTAIKCVSDGGQGVIYPDTKSSIGCLLDQTIPVDNSTKTSPEPPNPIPDEPLHIVHIPEEISVNVSLFFPPR